MASFQPQPSDFTQVELEQALSEQSFGITSYKITSSTDLQASARVVLLEGNTITISLTSRGYEVIDSSSAEPESNQAGNIFEDVEHLLQSVSNQYSNARQKALMERLTLLSAETSP
ncbi:unnamed protein product [Somion occarium]|uniref:GSKIP domain-containing protein n=1 Tax=Somion occarium TaxID=3059160 RepID=A0ABP1E032_9APHY